MKNIGFGELLAVVFITLKLCGVISWSWWWVLSPVTIPPALGLLAGAVGLLGAFLGRPRTPREKAAAALLNYADALGVRRAGRGKP